MLININQAIIWAAGFLEGDGCFTLVKGKYLCVTVDQVNPEPITDLVRWFGGNLYHRARKNTKKKEIYTWTLTRQDGAALMMTIYSFMSEKRKSQIKKCLKVWRIVSIRCQRKKEYKEQYKRWRANRFKLAATAVD